MPFLPNPNCFSLSLRLKRGSLVRDHNCSILERSSDHALEALTMAWKRVVEVVEALGTNTVRNLLIFDRERISHGPRSLILIIRHI